jgi:hypothetical protein
MFEGNESLFNTESVPYKSFKTYRIYRCKIPTVSGMMTVNSFLYTVVLSL